jgi:LysM repeat protein
LAPIAIVAVAAAGYGIARGAMGDDDEPDDRPATTRTPKAATTERETPAPQRPAKRTYVVKAGDTLSAISLDTGVSVARLEQLNEDIDVQALQPGERLKLRP